MKIGFFSDTHGKHLDFLSILEDKGVISEFLNCDTLVFCGDMCSSGSLSEVKNFLDWFSSLPNKNKICIAGNHDKFLDSNLFLFLKPKHERQREITKLLNQYNNITYLKNNSVVIDNIKFWGSPITPTFGRWAFNKNRGSEIKEVWEKIPNDTDILITHGPPKNILDLLDFKFRRRNEDPNVGCKDLSNVIEKIKPMIVSFGHIHEQYGVLNTENTLYINCSVMDQCYNLVNLPIFIEKNNN